jgi:hypothetical protein
MKTGKGLTRCSRIEMLIRKSIGWSVSPENAGERGHNVSGDRHDGSCVRKKMVDEKSPFSNNMLQRTLSPRRSLNISLV